ncbi:galactose oxidase-like domain-containing protein [Pedococcus sp. 5OH_020]|uniref:galactose oxidase-like domain-containing protein n=1 Tax=Pedococcus sp. 5OH_020 TaxID=2989814 RepID=UPI0022EA02CC|nr:galactose oxidase-like domain-containing protein [Pedococcus sp. 5OH_020]
MGSLLVQAPVALAAGTLSLDRLVSTHGTASTTSVTSPVFTTAQPGELLLAFVSTDGPSTPTQAVSSVTGAGLTWRLRQRTNAQLGTAEIWQAVTPAILTNVSVRATYSGSFLASISVATFTGASLTVDGATKGASAATGAPTAALTTSRAGSWVWAVGNDYDNAIARTVGTGQTKVDEYLASSGDTLWVQRQNAVTPSAGTPVTINDTAPTADRWNLSLVEIPVAADDTTAPTAPTNLTAAAPGPTQVNLSWTAATDDTGVTGYRILRGASQIGTTTSATTYSDTTATARTTYSYTVRAVDAAGNVSPDSVPASVTTPAPDTTPPTISAISSGTPTPSAATITWRTDEPSDSQVVYGRTTTYGSSTTLAGALVTSHSQTVAGLVASTTYHYQVRSADASGNVALSSDATFTTAAPPADTTPPSVSVTAPASGATVAGTVQVTATASDNVGVVGVQLRLDGAALGSEDITAPYSVPWDTTAATDGAHQLSAVARDAAGNTTTATTVSVTVSNGSADPSLVGSWGPVQAWPEVSIHAALTYTGKVLTFQGDFTTGGQQYLLDPTTGATTQVPNAAADLFCAGQAVLADGRILVVGGTATSGGLGITAVTAFNPATQVWQTLAPMHHPRWYPTATTLADGRVLVTSGSNGSLTDLVQTPEVYDPQTNTWTDLTTATRSIPYYPFMYQLPDGRVLQAGASEEPTSTLALDVATQQWSTVDSRVVDAASITNYAPGKFLKAGSASDSGFTGPSASTAYTLDLNQPGATWQPTAAMAFPRSFVNLTNLPDGTVLATGGGTDKSGYVEANAVLPAEVWNRTSGTWRTVASMTVPRLYHSVALLLPDGRVFVSGSGGDAGVADENNYQIYSPSYLFKGARPTISSAPSTVRYGGTASIKTPDAGSISSVSLIRTGSVTHSFDQNTRALTLPFTAVTGGLDVQLPANGKLAPPGYYLLSIVNGSGVPSVSTVVRFPAPSEDIVAPSAPPSLTATGGIGRVDLTWAAATDDIGVAAYDVYRSTTAGFLPGPANQVAQVAGTSTSYRDAGLPAGTYYYRVKSEDAAANLSPPSVEATATVLSDTTAPNAPTALTATATSGQVALSWTAATDNVGVVRYNVSRGGATLGTSTVTRFTDTGVVAGTTYSYTVTAQDAAGNVGPASNTATATVPSGARQITVDKLVSSHQGSAATTVSAPGVTTTGTNELILAFVSSDGPSGSGTESISGVSGGGLTWTLRQRANAQPGTAEIWRAVAATPLSNATITATQASGSFQSSLTVVALLGADTAPGAVTATSASSGAPAATLTTTRAGSWVWGVGTDWSTATSRTVGTGQTLVDQFLAPAADTYWVQRQNAPTPASGTAVTINDTGPVGDRYDLALVEVLASP